MPFDVSAMTPRARARAVERRIDEIEARERRLADASFEVLEYGRAIAAWSVIGVAVSAVIATVLVAVGDPVDPILVMFFGMACVFLNRVGATLKRIGDAMAPLDAELARQAPDDPRPYSSRYASRRRPS